LRLLLTTHTFAKSANEWGTRLKLDALNVEWIEKGTVLYYWAHGRYRTIEPSD
jgi:hypothetical protein